MARSTPGVTRQRIVDEATRLFADQGYEVTSIADIQIACGLTGGSGALYKHFPSKRALLEEIVRQHLAGMADTSQQTPQLSDDPREVLGAIGKLVWERMSHDRDSLRIVFRELDRFPDLLEQMWSSVLGDVYATATAWIRGGIAEGRMAVADPEATAAVLMASLTYYPILHALTGHTPGDVGEDGFLTAWVDHAARTLGID